MLNLYKLNKIFTLHLQDILKSYVSLERIFIIQVFILLKVTYLANLQYTIISIKNIFVSNVFMSRVFVLDSLKKRIVYSNEKNVEKTIY